MKVVSVVSAIILFGVAMPAQAQGPAGETLFKQRCAMCHQVKGGTTPGVGPDLKGLVGRPAASTGFAYSPALKKSGLKWDQKTLDTFLTAPGKLAPGTRMVVSVPDAQQRSAIIAYLAKQK